MICKNSLLEKLEKPERDPDISTELLAGEA